MLSERLRHIESHGCGCDRCSAAWELQSTWEKYHCCFGHQSDDADEHTTVPQPETSESGMSTPRQTDAEQPLLWRVYEHLGAVCTEADPSSHIACNTCPSIYGEGGV